MADTESVLLEERAGMRLTLTLNRPDRRNALSPELVQALSEALGRADADPGVRLIVLTGAGDKAFCAGGDLGAGVGAQGISGSAQAYAQLIQRMDELGKPLLARVQGHCVGGGVGLMLGCDLAVAARSAKIGTPEVRSGIFPMMIAPLIVRHVGPKKAMEMFFTGQRMSADEALEAGLLNRVVDDAALDREVDALAEAVLSVSPSAIAHGRRALSKTRHLTLAEATPILAEELVQVLSTEDAMEGIAAFFEKRKPVWKGR